MPRWRLRPVHGDADGRPLAITHRAQHTAERLLRDSDQKIVPQPLAKIDDALADHAVNRWNGVAVNRCHQRSPVPLVEHRWLSRSLAIHQAFRAMRIELQHTVTLDLQGHTTDLGRLPARVPPSAPGSAK